MASNDVTESNAIADSRPKLMGRSAARGLGRGLNALFDDEEVVNATSPQSPVQQTPASVGSDRSRRNLGIAQLIVGDSQPRVDFDEAELESLAASVRAHGILQPILVRPHPLGGDRFEIIAGERRWRAAQRAQLHEVPVVIRELDDQQALEIALIENLQRANLNPVEEAQGYRKLVEKYGHTQEALAQRIGKSRSHITNMLRILTLPQYVLDMVRSGKLSMGHARILVNMNDPGYLANAIIAQNLSVRQAERLVAASAPEDKKNPQTSHQKKPAGKDVNLLAVERKLSEHTGLRVSILQQGGKGEMRIVFRTPAQLEDMIGRILRSESGAAGPLDS